MRYWLIILAALPGWLLAAEWSGYLELQGRYHQQTPAAPEQRNHSLSLAISPEFYHSWDGGQQTLLFAPFFRADTADNERSHGDIRELIWTKAVDNWELKAGVGRVFWGVTESVHLVDVINQTDLVENLDGEQKLGQPMVKFSLEQSWGTVDLYILAGFRERTFAGTEGRLRTLPRVDRDLVSYESGRRDNRIDFALRWSHYIGDWDIGLAYFDGTNRDPILKPASNQQSEVVLAPYYELMQQASLDLQATKGDWLWKLETIHRRGQGGSYNAAVVGFEYTRVGIADSVMDLGVLTEYLYDSRDQACF